MNLTYEKCGDYLIPNIIPDPEPGEELRKFGLMRKNYLKEYKSGIYQGMVLSGKLKEHLLMVQEQAELQFDVLVEQMAEREGVTEQLKEENQMLWAQKMNNIRARAEEIVEYACFRYGYYNAQISGKIGNGFVDDFQYFVFTKSIKSLGSIRELLRLGHVEDVFIILRTSFEGYIASRYIDEEYNTDILNDFIFIPQLIAARKIIYQNGKAVERGTQEIIEYIQRNPSDMKLGRDKRYFYDFYAFLCNYAHCNFSIINEFIDDGQFSCDKSDNIYMAKVMTLFVYIKLFESIVTVEGEDFLNSREEKECYKLVRESTKFIYDRLEEFSKYNCTCGYVQLGGCIVSKKVAEYFEENVLQCGLTYSGHTLACAAGVAAMKYYKEHDIEGHVAEMHEIVAPFMDEMVKKHKCIGEARCIGLFGALEVVKNKETREPMQEYGVPGPVMPWIFAELKKRGFATFGRENFIEICPPLIITKEELEEYLPILDEVLTMVDEKFCD